MSLEGDVPDFVLSYPVQVVTSGIVLAFSFSLLLHVVFTAAYHVPLSRANFVLQLTSNVLMLVAECTKIGIILSEMARAGAMWPYMFPFVAPRLPNRSTWSTTQVVFFALLQMLTLLFSHGTHIQFLTLLFPSVLETRMIYWMLGPLVLIMAGMSFGDLASDDDLKTLDLSDAFMNICDSSLALLYMAALLIWGALVNWRRAWRGDGSTAAFGTIAVVVAVLKTVISFVHIGYDRVYWMRDLSAIFTVWQSWLGFWWWVSAGMNIGEYADRLRAQERRTRRQQRQRRRPLKRPSAPAVLRMHRGGDADTADGPGPDETPEESPGGSSDVSPQTYLSTTDSAPWTVRLARRIGRLAPDAMQRRFEHLRSAHSSAVNRAAVDQAASYARVMQSWVPSSDLLRRLRLQDKTMYE